MMSSPLWGVCDGGGGGGGVGGGSARRCLFGAVDHVTLKNDYTLLMKAELEDASRRWNFDFTADKPHVGGDFDWVELPAIQVPFVYRQCTVGAEPRPKGAEPQSDLQNEGTSAEKHTLKRKQTNITDFYQAKRRVVTARKSGQ